MSAAEDQHIPVLRDAVLEQLQLPPAGICVDGTFGRGGHSRAILDHLGPDGRLIVVDRDPRAIATAEMLAEQDQRVTVVRGSFGDIERIADGHGVLGRVDGVLLDLGVSSPQLDDPERGFSFLRDGPLDMRMDPATPVSAEDWLNSATEKEIARVIFRYGDEQSSRRIARAICSERDQQRINRTGQLADLIEALLPRRGKRKHPATKTFQAVRIHINNELGELQLLLETILKVLAPGGRLCVISFHSLEDRIVKRFLRDNSRVDPRLASLPVVPESARPAMRIVSSAIRPTTEECERNPRARSAVFRAGEKLA